MDIKKKIVLTLSIEECNVVKAGLLELPGKICNPVLAVMDKQVMEQLKPAEEKSDGAEKDN